MVVETTSGVTEQAAAAANADKGETTQHVDNTGSAADDSAQVHVPLRVVTALKDEVKHAKAQAKQLSEQLAAFNQQQSVPQPKPSKEPEKGPLDGLDDSDIVTVADVKKILKSTSSNSGALTSKLEHIQFAIDHPDYKEAIGDLGKSLKDDPDLAARIHADIKTSGNPLATAYNYAKLVSRAPTQSKTGKTEIDIMVELETILANQNKPGSPAQVQGSGGGVSKAEKIKAMTPEEFDRHLDRIKNGG